MKSRPASLSPRGRGRTGWPYREGRYLHMVLHEITSSIANTMREKRNESHLQELRNLAPRRLPILAQIGILCFAEVESAYFVF